MSALSGPAWRGEWIRAIKKLSPNHGARVLLTRFHPIYSMSGVSLEPVTGQTVPPTCKQLPVRFQIYARGGFSVGRCWRRLSIFDLRSLSVPGPPTRPGQRLIDYTPVTTGWLVGETGLEPATFAMSTRCSNQLSYPPEQSAIIPRWFGFDNAWYNPSRHAQKEIPRGTEC